MSIPSTPMIESVILRHSGRGMDLLYPHVLPNFCEDAAKYIASWPKGNIFLLTGFYVAGYAETDGPLGTLVLADALQKMGYTPYIITDKYCKDFFENYIEHIIYAPIDAKTDYYEQLIEQYQPVGMISIERCGRNSQDDYANMRGISIANDTAALDELFILAKSKKIPTVGIGDGGNEIGMGNLSHIIRNQLSLVPCEIGADKLVIATISNWGAYGLACYLGQMTSQTYMYTFETLKKYLAYIVSLGSVDGVFKENVMSIDGFPLSVEEEIVNALQ